MTTTGRAALLAAAAWVLPSEASAGAPLAIAATTPSKPRAADWPLVD